MKYYIVLDPILHTYPYCIFSKPQAFDRETVLTAFHKQSKAKLFGAKDQALYYAENLSAEPSPCKTSGLIAPIIECELHSLGANSVVAKMNFMGKPIIYVEVPVEEIENEALDKIIFSNANMPSINLRSRSLGCSIM